MAVVVGVGIGGAVVNGNVDVVELVVLCLGGNIVPAFRKIIHHTIVDISCTDKHLGVARIIGDVQPETDGHGVRAVDGGELQVQSMEAGFEDLGEVALHSQSILTVSDHTGGGVHDVDVATLVLTMVPERTIILGYLTVGASGTILAIVGVDGPAGEILILEVIDDLGTLTQAQVGGDGQLAHNGGQDSGGNFRAFLSGGELKTADGTDTIVGQAEGNVGCLQDHVLAVISSGDIQGDRLAERHDHVFLAEDDGIGHDDVDGILTHNSAVVDHLDSHIALGAIGNEQTVVVNGTEGCVSQLPGSLCGNLSSGTNQVGTHSAELHRGTGGVVVLSGADGCAVEFAGGRSSGDDQNAVGGITLSTVGGRAVDLQVLAGTLGQESGGTAAVTVDSIDTAQAQHELSHFIAVETGGEGSLTTVIHDDDDAAVSLDAHEGAGSGIGGVVLAVLVHAILDQEAKVGGDDLLFPAGDRILGGADLGLGHISRAGNAVLLIKVDDQTGLCAAGLALAVLIQLTVQNQVAQGLTHQFRMLHIVGTVVPAQSNVHGSDNVAVAIGLGIGSLLRHNLNLVVLSLQALSHLVSAGDHLGVRIVDVDFYNVGHLTVRTSIVVQDDLGFGNTGSQNIVGLTDYVVVIIFAGGVDDLRGTEIACIRCDCGTVSFGCKGIHGQQTHDHHNCQKHGQEPSLRGVTHVVFLLLEVSFIIKKLSTSLRTLRYAEPVNKHF